ncbi:hypothetical protein MRY87_11710 [bacterium]|nr:hypothetical protein [bacterium]
MRAAEKINDGLAQILEGFLELQTQIESDFSAEKSAVSQEEEEDESLRVEIDAALVTELRASLESIMDAEDYSSDEIASFLSVAQDALEEIDPDVFEESEEEEESEEASYYDEDDDDDYDYEDGEDEEEYDDEEEEAY